MSVKGEFNMKTKILFLLTLLFAGSAISFAQTKQPNSASNENSNQQAYIIEDIARELSKISKSVEELNKRLEKFSQTFSSNQGLKLTERQQKLLIAFEFLNRAEQRLVSLQNLKLNFTEKQTAIRLQLARITDDLLPGSIDRYVSLRGTTNAEELREIRRQALLKEKYDLTRTVAEIQNDLNEINEEIRQTDMFLKNIRRRLFPEVEKELLDL
jgi:peptidoglycan hydrolase CwlO-like protein